MKVKLHLVILLLLLTGYTKAQQFYLPKSIANDSAALAAYIPVLAKDVLMDYKGDINLNTYLSNLFRLQMIAGDYASATTTIDSVRVLYKAKGTQYANLLYIQYEL
jgi:uncharacterized protein